LNGSLQKKGNVYYAVISQKDEYGKFKPRWISTRCNKKADAKKVLNRILNEFENGEYIEKSNMMFVDYLEYWLNNIIINEVEKTTWEGICIISKLTYAHILRKENIKLQDVETIHLQRYFNEKYKNGRKDGKGGLSANLLKKHHANIKKALDYAINIGYIKVNPVNNVAMPKVKKFVGKVLTVNDVEKLLKAVKGTVIESMIVLMVNYGLRRGEALGLRWRDIDFESKNVFICNTRIRVKEIVEKQPKSEASLRTLPLIPSVEKYLLNLKEQQQQDKLLMGNCYTDCDYVCRKKDGIPINMDTCNGIFKESFGKTIYRTSGFMISDIVQQAFYLERC
jgi:integrase